MPETEFKLRRIETNAGPFALVTIDNEDDSRPTTFGPHALASLEHLLPELEEGDWKGLVLTGKPSVFAAGADIDQFVEATPEFARAGSRLGHDLFGRIRALPYPTLAAVNGACLGGGVELALHCRYRTISSDVRHFACPEVFLGIVPAWGGTQLIPRLVGAETAIRFVVENPLRQNRMLDAGRAFEAGFADRLLEPAAFLDESIAFLTEEVAREADRAVREEADLSGIAEAVAKARLRLEDQVHGAAPAPYVALDLLEGAARWSLEEGYRREEEALAELLPGPQAQASIYAFDLVERRTRRRPGIPQVEPRHVTKVGVVGAGLMATQIATVMLLRLELPIVLSDVDESIAESAVASIRDELQARVARGRIDDERARVLGSIATASSSYEDYAGCDLVLEAVIEELAVKRQVFAALEEVVSPECLLATNTSSLSVTEIGAELRHPERLLGMHFFNPVPLMPLVELIRTPATDDRTLATAAAVAEKLRKRGVLVTDAPGFVVNRVLTRMTSVLMEAIHEGTPVEVTDAAILGLGMPMAPSILLQMVGPRVANHVLHSMHEAFPDRFPLSPTLEAYAEGRHEPVVSQQAPRTAEEVRRAALEAMADEIARILEEGVVASAKDVDTCLLLGAGFPFFLGGITKHLDQTGVSERVVGRTLAELVT